MQKGEFGSSNPIIGICDWIQQLRMIKSAYLENVTVINFI